jgi:hypothetical protein
MTDSSGRTSMSPADDPSWEHYSDTILELLADRSLVVDLTRPLPADALTRLEEQGVGTTFAVLTACNPYGRATNEDSNRGLTQRLLRDITQIGLAWVPADGVAPDGAHREAGIAVLMPKADARLLACKYGQSVFFWFDGSSMWIVGAVVDTPDIRLPI